MVRGARAVAAVVRRQVGTARPPTYEDLLKAADALGVAVDEAVPLPRGVSAVVANGRVGLNAALSGRCRPWALAQGIGLAYYEGGPVLAHGTAGTAGCRRRRWAELFAGFLFWPGGTPAALLALSPSRLAEAAGLPEACAASFMHCLAEEAAPVAPAHAAALLNA